MRKSQPGLCIKLDLRSESRRTRLSNPINESHLKLKLRNVAIEGSPEYRQHSCNRYREYTPCRKDYVRSGIISNNSPKERLVQPQRHLRNGKSPSIQTERYVSSALKIRSQGKSHRSIKTLETIQGKCEIFVLENGTKTRHVIKATIVEDLNRKLTQDNNSEIVCYTTSPTNLVYDYYLSQPECDIRFLNDKTITLRPYIGIHIKRIDLRSFEVVRCIGAGGFSKVYLARFKQDGKFYALKLIDKHFIVENRKKGIIENERRIMALLNHPFTLGLKFSFETADLLVFAMDYCAGGSLFTYVKHFRTMTEEMARFFMLQILLGIQHLHDKDIVYRDIKPENILVGLDGHIKIADFGLAKPNITRENQAYSFCGSPEYMAPEMIMKVGHSHSVDFYCLGALLYELVTGLPPFYSSNTEQIYESVLTENLTFPEQTILSNECKNLILALLNKNHNLRLGSINGVREILSHPWFGKFRRHDVLHKLLRPPIKIDDIKTVTYNLMASEQFDDMNRLIEKQQRSDMQFFRKIMKNFYYDYSNTTTQLYTEKENHSIRSPTLNTLRTELSYPKVEDYANQKRFHLNQRKSPQGSKKLKRQSRNVLNQSNNLYTLRKGEYA